MATKIHRQCLRWIACLLLSMAVLALTACNLVAYLGGGFGLACADDHACPAQLSCVEGLCDLASETSLGPGVWVSLEAARFTMGSASQELGRDNDESQHEVNLLQPFVILSTEVTQFNYKRVMGYNPAAATNCGDDCPVEQISWHEAAQFCNALSARDSLPACYTCSGSTAATSSCTRAADFATPYDCPGYRLPTEAEWEYAARADTVTASYRADLDAEHLSCEQQNPALEDIAWFCGSSGGQPHQVATRQANAWQLYDMLGNVWEWCDDAYAPYPAATSVENPYTNQGQRQLMRGGDFGAEAHLVRAAQRASEIAAARHANLGFRPVRSLLP